MGCASSLAHIRFKEQTLAEKAPLCDLVLTDHERYLVRKTWKSLCDNMPGIGTKILLRLFIKNPPVKNLFPFRDAIGEELLRDPVFKNHACLFMQMVGATVENIKNLETCIVPLMFAVGRDHTKYEGFTADYFDAFLDAIFRVWDTELRSQFTREVALVWKRVLEFLVKQMKDGFKDAQMKKGMGVAVNPDITVTSGQ